MTAESQPGAPVQARAGGVWGGPAFGRRALLGGSLAIAGGAQAAGRAIRVGALAFGSVDWELDVIRVHGLADGVAVEAVPIATGPAAQVALLGGRVDVIVQDWFWVSRQRAGGGDWSLSPTSGAAGAVMTPAGSSVHAVADLVGRRLGVAGSPLDKSWLILRAYAERRLGLNLVRAVRPQFGAPPLLAAELGAGRLDAVLTYWPYAARAEAAGQRSILTVEQAVQGLGVRAPLPFVGYVFSERFARENLAALGTFLDAGRKARAILGRDDAEWRRLLPLTGATDDAELTRLRDWYRSGLPGAAGKVPLAEAGALYDILAAIGGPALVGPAPHLVAGTFWSG